MKHLLFLLLLASPAFADGPTINLPASLTARPGRLVVVKATTNGKAVKWVSLSDEADLLPYLDNSAIFNAATPGTYRILAYTALGDVPSEPAICTVTVGEPTPPIPPGPPPIPPTPKVAKVWAVLIVDNTARTPEMAKVINSSTLWKGLEAAGHEWRILDANSKAVTDYHYGPLVKEAGGVPALLLFKQQKNADGTSDKLKAVKIANEADIQAAIKEVTGK
jgi:hypothetical protein